MDQTKGLIIKSIGGLYSVKSPLGVMECKARGIFRKQNISPCVGDEVVVSDGVISEIMPRKNELIRPPLANLDYMIFVVSTCEPSPNFLLLDKFIAICVFKGIKPLIAVTKSDIKADDSITEIYKDSGAEVFVIDYSDESSFKALYDKIAGKLCAFTGNTGVGKSTLLNHLDSDTILKDELAGCFNEFEEYFGKCRFPDCSHTKEKGCAVIEAVKNGEIPPSRHESYVAMYEEAKQIKEWEIGK